MMLSSVTVASRQGGRLCRSSGRLLVVVGNNDTSTSSRRGFTTSSSCRRPDNNTNVQNETRFGLLGRSGRRCGRGGSTVSATSTPATNNRYGLRLRRQPLSTTTTNAASSDPRRLNDKQAADDQAAAAADQDDRIRLTSLRLYRILLRSAKTLVVDHHHHDDDDDDDDDSTTSSIILIQPSLNPHGWGRHATYTPPRPTQLEELYRLFYVWNDDDDDDDDDDIGNRGRDPGRPRNAIWDSGIGSSSSSGQDGPPLFDNSSPSAYVPSSIDDWYYELVSKRRPEPDGNEMSSTSSSSTSSSSTSSLSTMPPMTSMTLWTTPQQVQEAIRSAFKKLKQVGSPSSSSSTTTTTRLDSLDLHKWAIRAIQLLQEQRTLWKHSSTAVTKDRVVRVTATSRCIETGSSAASSAMMPPTTTPQMMVASTKYRFAYRVRVENISQDQTVQLVGRYWHISEEEEQGHVAAEMAGNAPPPESTPIEVNAPYTGAVGQLPVLQPGQVFEYMSGTDLGTPRGVMRGHLYMARVPSTTPSAKSGDEVQALKAADSATNWTKEEEDEVEGQMFQAQVAPFVLDSSSRV